MLITLFSRQIYKKIEFSGQILEKFSNIKILYVGEKLVHRDRRTDRQAGRQVDRQTERQAGRQTDMTRLTIFFRNSATQT
jgi:hypothetical protein